MHYTVLHISLSAGFKITTDREISSVGESHSFGIRPIRNFYTGLRGTLKRNKKCTTWHCEINHHGFTEPLAADKHVSTTAGADVAAAALIDEED